MNTDWNKLKFEAEMARLAGTWKISSGIIWAQLSDKQKADPIETARRLTSKEKINENQKQDQS